MKLRLEVRAWSGLCGAMKPNFILLQGEVNIVNIMHHHKKRRRMSIFNKRYRRNHPLLVLYAIFLAGISGLLHNMLV